MTFESLNEYFPDWKEREALAESMIPMIGSLYRRNVLVEIYGRELVNRSVLKIMKVHRFVRQVAENELSEFETYPIVKAVSELDLRPCSIDIGKMAVKYMELENAPAIEDFVKSELAAFLQGENKLPLSEPQDVVLYGFGRIGRLLARILIDHTGGGDKLRLRAVVVRKGKGDDLQKRASLLRRDSVHGSFPGTIRIDEERQCLIINGNPVHVIYANDPSQIDYTAYDINNAIIIDNTGVWRDQEALSQHLKSKGTSKVVLTAPSKGEMKNVVYGINNDIITDEDTIVSAASCTTNAITPPLKAIHDEFGIEHGHVETVHSYTNDQNLIDNYHSAERRGRSAALNMVITTTGAVKAVALAFPEMKGKLTGNAIRVPTPNVSLAILNLTLAKDTTVEGLNAYLRKVAFSSPLQDQIDYMNSPDLVSTDFVGSRYACVIDSGATIVNGNQAVVYAWYDNEYGYSRQVMRIVEQMAGLKFETYPEQG